LRFPANLKINEIQVLGTHYSYAQPVDTALNYIDPILERVMGGFPWICLTSKGSHHWKTAQCLFNLLQGNPMLVFCCWTML
jgi:hypothetical protein